MSLVVPVDAGWLVLFVNGYSPQAQTAAGDSAVPAGLADQDQPAVSSRVRGPEKARLAGRLWRVFGYSTQARTGALDALISTSRLKPHVDAEGHLVWSSPVEHAVGRLTAACTVCLIEAITEHGWERLGICCGRDCADTYLDRARRGPRRYCSATCLNRAKVRAFRSRQATQDPRDVHGDRVHTAKGQPEGDLHDTR